VTDYSTKQFFRADPQSQTAYPIAKAGWPIIGAAAFVTFVLALIGSESLALIGMGATLFICNFFRDPDRVTPASEKAVISPADGRIVFTGVVNENPFVVGPCLKIGIFMNIFNVHVNRIPFSGTVKKISYFPGKFYSANKEKASTDNEHNAVVLETENHGEIGVVQIAGLIARRIICQVREGDRMTCGQRFGLICFGSRVDVYLPPETTLTVVKGDKVKAGLTILGYVK
jgi:phosphatidylserine decarboxylase